MQQQLLDFGEQYKDVPALYAIYLGAKHLAYTPGLTQEEVDQFMMREPLREEMLAYARKITGNVPLHNEEVAVLRRQIASGENDGEALALLKQELERAQSRVYNSYTLKEPTFLNQYGEHDRGSIRYDKLEEYEHVMALVRQLDVSQTEYDVSDVRIKFSRYKRDKLKQRSNMRYERRGATQLSRTMEEEYYKRRKNLFGPK